MPHPSVTGMAAGLTVASYLNTGGAGVFSATDVIKSVTDGKLSHAFSLLSKNAINLASSTTGQQALSSAIVLATAGGLARKWFPSVKLGGNKLFFKI